MQNDKLKYPTGWAFCKIAVLILLVLTFTPLITPSGKYEPSLMGLPYTLWVGMIQAIILVGITWLGTQVHPGRND